MKNINNKTKLNTAFINPFILIEHKYHNQKLPIIIHTIWADVNKEMESNNIIGKGEAHSFKCVKCKRHRKHPHELWVIIINIKHILAEINDSLYSYAKKRCRSYRDWDRTIKNKLPKGVCKMITLILLHEYAHWGENNKTKHHRTDWDAFLLKNKIV